MSDLAKWVILVTAAVAVIALIVALPVTEMIDLSALSEGLTIIADRLGYYLMCARGFLNLFVPEGFEWLITASISWNILSKFLTWAVNIASQAAHYIFK